MYVRLSAGTGSELSVVDVNKWVSSEHLSALISHIISVMLIWNNCGTRRCNKAALVQKGDQDEKYYSNPFNHKHDPWSELWPFISIWKSLFLGRLFTIYGSLKSRVIQITNLAGGVSQLVCSYMVDPHVSAGYEVMKQEESHNLPDRPRTPSRVSWSKTIKSAALYRQKTLSYVQGSRRIMSDLFTHGTNVQK